MNTDIESIKSSSRFVPGGTMKPTLPALIACAFLLLGLQPLSAATDGEIEQALMARVPELFANGQVITRGDLDTIGADLA